MCHQVQCDICGMTTWAGCGQHVDQVMRKVPKSQRCPGHSAAERRAAQKPGLLSRMFSR